MSFNSILIQTISIILFRISHAIGRLTHILVTRTSFNVPIDYNYLDFDEISNIVHFGQQKKWNNNVLSSFWGIQGGLLRLC